jgi:hypothetical protein
MKINKYLILSIIVFSSSIFLFDFSGKGNLLILATIMFLIMFVFLKIFIIDFVENAKVNFFYLLLVFYMLTLVLKHFNFLFDFADATAFYIITSIAQIFFGLYFSIIREHKQESAVQSR